MEKMKCEPRRLKDRGKEERGKCAETPEGKGEKERHALAKPRLVAVLRSKLRFTRFLQVPTGSHCLSSSPLAFRLFICPTLLFHSLFSLLSHSTVRLTLSFFLPLAFRLISRLLLFLLFIISVLPQSTSGLHWFSSSPLAFRRICRLLLFLLSIISVLPQSTSGLHWLSLISSI